MHFDWRSFLDWISIVSALATVVAAALAWRAIALSARQARENTALVVSERRRDVQLDALQRLGDVVGLPEFNGEQRQQRKTLAAVQLAIIDAPMPLCRARFGTAPFAEVVSVVGLPDAHTWREIDEVPDEAGRALAERMAAEIAEAVRSLAL